MTHALTNAVKSVMNKHRKPEPVRKGKIYPDDVVPLWAKVYWVHVSGIVLANSWANLVYDKESVAQGGIFWDIESAKYEAKRREVKHRFEGMAVKAWRDAGMEIDWSDGEQPKYSVSYDHVDKDWFYRFSDSFFQQEGATYFPSPHSLMDAIEALGEDERYLR